MRPKDVREKLDPFFIGGNLLFDFCNTEVGAGERRVDLIPDPKSLSRFVFLSLGLSTTISPTDFKQLRKWRQVLRGFFSDPVRGFSALNDQLSVGVKSVSIALIGGNRFEFTPILKSEAPLQKAIISELVRFLSIADRSRMKKCANPDCTHLFYDQTKNAGRTWCTMASCGNLMKARAFQKRRRAKKLKIKTG